MKSFKTLLVSIVLAVGFSCAWASDASSTMSFNKASSSYVADFANFGPLVLDGGSDVFTFGLPSGSDLGTYHVVASFGGSGLNIDWAKTNLNGILGAPVITGPGFDFGVISVNTQSPFVLTVYGNQVGAFQAFGGHLDASLVTPLAVAAVTSVPEPESYAMMLAGLGMIGSITSRRSKL
jgi:hypothetical protein